MCVPVLPGEQQGTVDLGLGLALGYLSWRRIRKTKHKVKDVFKAKVSLGQGRAGAEPYGARVASQGQMGEGRKKGQCVLLPSIFQELL